MKVVYISNDKELIYHSVSLPSMLLEHLCQKHRVVLKYEVVKNSLKVMSIHSNLSRLLSYDNNVIISSQNVCEW